MFFHKQELQYKTKPSKPDAIYARRMQEVLGGQYGEISVAMQYAFQGWNMHIPGKYRDLVFGIAAEEFGHVEMLAVMIAQLLEKAPVEQSEAAASSPTWRRRTRRPRPTRRRPRSTRGSTAPRRSRTWSRRPPASSRTR